MEPRPTEGHTFVHSFGNYSTDFFAVGANNTFNEDIHIPANSGKYELKTGNYTFTSKDGSQTFKLHLSLSSENENKEKPRGFVVGIFNTSNGNM